MAEMRALACVHCVNCTERALHTTQHITTEHSVLHSVRTQINDRLLIAQQLSQNFLTFIFLLLASTSVCDAISALAVSFLAFY